ncbi:tRNA-splicing endonuclease subunit Sen15 isoform X1 [Cyanistes caeruleus]|uniref:tRNA splicing endonuclease subunit 15 n=1 Tax=Cyanistes caeruleus TaxID=156563 RepID=A0A8C0VF70_CYACU|nr:tRNA-splicing endonuclease subunit Sen15 isoform X1 [Cyanistes caeruleus]
MEPVAGPGWSGICPATGGEGGTDSGQDYSAAGRALGAQGSWSGAAGCNWITIHPTFTEMMSLDVSDSTQVYAAFLVYLDLLEGRNWHEVQPVGVEELQLVCLHARAKEQEALQVMVPVPAHILISHERLLQNLLLSQTRNPEIPGISVVLSSEPKSNWLREILKKASLPAEDPDTLVSVTLAIVETDSTIVYYKMTDGFVMPDPPDDTEDVDNKQWRKKRKKLFK